jgi:hypothetical protein
VINPKRRSHPGAASYLVPHLCLWHGNETISVLPDPEAEIEVFIVEIVTLVKKTNSSQCRTVQEYSTS